MDIAISLFTILCALGTVISRKTVTASFFFLLAICGVASAFFQLSLIPLALLVLFSGAFWLIVYFLFSTLLSEEASGESTLSKKPRLYLSASIIAIFLMIAGLYLYEVAPQTLKHLAHEDILDYWKTDFILNYPFLLLCLLLLITSLVMVLFMSWKPFTEQTKEST